MRRAAALIVLAGLGSAVPGALAADPPSLPSVTVPQVTTPAVTTPVVTVPKVTTPAVTTPAVTTPAVTTPAVKTPVPVPAPKAPAPAPAPTPSAPSPSVPATAPSSSYTAPSYNAPAYNAPASRSGHAASSPAARRPATVTRFRLAHAGRVRVTVWQESPRCRLVGRYTVRANRGANTLALRRSVGTHRLRIGTYHLVGLAVGAQVLDVRVRLVRVKGKLRVRHTGLRNACSAAQQNNLLAAIAPSAAGAVGAGSGGATGSKAAHDSSSGKRGAFKPPDVGGNKSASGSHAIDVLPKSTGSRALLFILVGLALALLASASLPDRVAAVGVVARHRAVVTSAGITLLVAAALIVLL